MTEPHPQSQSLLTMPQHSGPAPVSATLLAAVVQYEALGTGNGGAAVARNVAAHVELVEKAHADGARLVLFPELSLTGYELGSFNAPEQEGQPSAWLTDGDPRLQPLRHACARTGTTAVIGAGWREADGTPRLASLIIGPDGSLRPAFKTHLHGEERELFVAGSGPEILVVDGWRVALAVCADAAQPSHAAAAAESGAEVYAVSALYVSGEELRLGLHLGSRSMDHRMFGLLANLGGKTPLGSSCGLSGGWGPEGAAVAKAAGTGTETVMVNLVRSSLEGYRSGRGA